MFDEDPKFAVWVSALCLLSMLALGKQMIELKRRVDLNDKIEQEINKVFGDA